MKNVIFKTRNVLQKYFVIMLISLLSFAGFSSCDELDNLNLGLTEEEVAEGLREALRVGIKNAVLETNRLDGYYGNPLIKIPWPEEAQGAYDLITDNSYLSTLRPYLDDVVLKMNRGAEEAAGEAANVFVDAITSMTIQDAWDILKGEDNAATAFLNRTTFDGLYHAFNPKIESALESVGAASAWNTITTNYNSIVTNSTFLYFNDSQEPLNTDLSDYTTNRALNGLFMLVESEELKIREDPAARVNDILKRVFGELD